MIDRDKLYIEKRTPDDGLYDISYTSGVLKDLTEFVKDAARTTCKEYISEDELSRFTPKTIDELLDFIEYLNNNYGVSMTLEPAKGVERRARIGESTKKAHERRRKAEQAGSLPQEKTMLATISSQDFGFSYLTNEVCKLLPGDARSFMVDGQGQLNIYQLTSDGRPISEVLQELEQIPTGFLMLLLQRAWRFNDIRESDTNITVPLYLPEIFDAVGVDVRPIERDTEKKKLVKIDTGKTMAELRLDKFMELLEPLHRTAAWFGNDLYAIATFNRYDATTETIYVNMPYMLKLVEHAKLSSPDYSIIQSAFNADVMNENPTTVEVANRIIMGVRTRGTSYPDQRRGKAVEPTKEKVTVTRKDGTRVITERSFDTHTITKTKTDENGIITTVTAPVRKEDRTYTWREKFSNIIADCPQLRHALDEIRNGNGADKSQRINKKLKDVFTGAVRIIMEKSDAPKYYKDLTIRTGHFDAFKAPTNSTLNSELIITNHGKNPNFTS